MIKDILIDKFNDYIVEIYFIFLLINHDHWYIYKSLKYLYAILFLVKF